MNRFWLTRGSPRLMTLDRLDAAFYDPLKSRTAVGPRAVGRRLSLFNIVA
jgi:hypothetical protein